MTKATRCWILRAATALLTVGMPFGIAWAHWTIASQISMPESGRTFELRLHYQLLAGQANPDEALRVCFWLERHQENRYAAITRRACQALTMRANDWKTLAYSVDSLPWLENRKDRWPLPKGRYRAIALIESDVNPIMRFFVGAAQDRKVFPFQIE